MFKGKKSSKKKIKSSEGGSTSVKDKLLSKFSKTSKKQQKLDPESGRLLNSSETDTDTSGHITEFNHGAKPRRKYPRKKNKKKPVEEYLGSSSATENDRDDLEESAKLAQYNLSDEKKAQYERAKGIIFELANIGDYAGIIRLFEDLGKADLLKIFDVNLTNFEGFSPLQIAVRRQDEQMVRVLLQHPQIDLKDTILHGAKEGNLEIIKMLYEYYVETVFKGREPVIAEIVESINSKTLNSEFTIDMTPLKIAAINGHFEIIAYFYSRGGDSLNFRFLSHKANCPCIHCQKYINFKTFDVYETNRKIMPQRERLNYFKALANPFFICYATIKSGLDPFVHSFHLIKHLRRMKRVDTEFVMEYKKLITTLRAFVGELIDVTQNQNEVSRCVSFPLTQKVSANQDEKKTDDYKINQGKFPRLIKAMQLEIKDYVAHPYVQMYIYRDWAGEAWPEWSRYSRPYIWSYLLIRFILHWPLSIWLVFDGCTSIAQFHKTPFNRYINAMISYLYFIVILLIHNHAHCRYEHGYPDTGIEWPIILYVLGQIFGMIKVALKGPKNYFFTSLWNWYDILCQTLFIITFLIWLHSYDVVSIKGSKSTSLPRSEWGYNHPVLIGEGFMCIASLMATIKCIRMLLLHRKLGPFIISLGAMIKDATRFALIITIFVFAFSSALTSLYKYFMNYRVYDAGLHETFPLAHFYHFSSTIDTLFWSIFGVHPENTTGPGPGDLYSYFPEIEEVGQISHQDFTYNVGNVIYGAFHVIIILILVNMLIAVMSNRYQYVHDHNDLEWKYNRCKVYLYYSNYTVLPPPFNLTLLIPIRWLFGKICKCCNCKWCCPEKYPPPPLYAYKNNYTMTEGEKKKQAEETLRLYKDMAQRYFRRRELERESRDPTYNDIKCLMENISEVKADLRFIHPGLKDSEIKEHSVLLKAWKKELETEKEQQKSKVQVQTSPSKVDENLPGPSGVSKISEVTKSSSKSKIPTPPPLPPPGSSSKSTGGLAGGSPKHLLDGSSSDPEDFFRVKSRKNPQLKALQLPLSPPTVNFVNQPPAVVQSTTNPMSPASRFSPNIYGPNLSAQSIQYQNPRSSTSKVSIQNQNQGSKSSTSKISLKPAGIPGRNPPPPLPLPAFSRQASQVLINRFRNNDRSSSISDASTTAHNNGEHKQKPGK